MAKPPRCRFCKKEHYGVCGPNEPVRPLTPVGEVEAPMTAEEVARYDQLKSTVKEHWAIVAEAIAEIQDRRLYRAEHPTFEAFCRAEMGFGRRRGEVLSSLNNTITVIALEGLPAPKSERTARALAALPPAKRTEAWRATVANHGAGATPDQFRDTISLAPAGVTPNIEAAEPARSDAAALRGASGPAPAPPPADRVVEELQIISAPVEQADHPVPDEEDALAALYIHAGQILVEMAAAARALPPARKREARKALSKIGQRYIEVAASL